MHDHKGHAFLFFKQFLNRNSKYLCQAIIATNYILGFDEELKAETHHFVQADAAEASKNGTLKELVDRCFG